LCSDKEIHSCENAVIELGRFDLHAENHAKPIAKAFIVHRLGSAVVTFNHEESAAGNHLLFNKFLAGTTHKICLSEEKTAKGADKTKLKSICPQNNKTVNGADDIMMRTWAVAGGAAKYEIIFASAHDDKDVYFSQSLVWSGDLVMVAENANETAVVTDRAHSGRDAWFKDKSIQLVNSDGAGALNFKLSFDDPAEEERISVVSNFAASKAPKLKKKQKDNAKVANDATPTKRS
jgi:hypothetical protein